MRRRLKQLSSAGSSYLAALLVFALFSAKAAAQTVTISPNTGNVIAAESTEHENHMAGYGGAWVHNQLPLTMLTSDEASLTDDGLPKNHANNIAPKGDKFIFCGGTSEDGYFTLSLPKGYRFTSYKMVITNNVTSTDFTESLGTGAYSMSERSGSFTGTQVASVNLGTRNTSSTREYTLQRTSDNMSNILYFRLGHASGQYAAVYVKSFEVSFECDQTFTATIRPTSATTSGVDCMQYAFGTERVDLGSITWSKGNKGNNYAFRYNYEKVKDLDALFSLYDKDGVSNGSASTSAKKNGNIKAANVNGGLHYALQNDVYYLETPTDAITQNGNSIPVGYRITGAKLHYFANINTPDPALGKSLYITDGNGKYMNSSLKFTTTPVVWQTDTEGYVWTISNGSILYLSQESSGTFGTTHTLKITATKTTKFNLDDNGLYYQGTLTHYVTKDGKLTSSKLSAGDAATILSAEKATGDFTLSLYGADGSTVAKTVNVNTTDKSGYLEVTGLNNDAIKFEVKDLNGTAAYVYAELTLEALNPYISKMDVVAKTTDGAKTLAQSYLADDFTIGDNGNVSFTVPDNFAASSVQIMFDNLTSKKADETYGPLSSDGNARYNFVKSDYYNTINEDLQSHRTEAANYDYTKKVAVEVAGNLQFKVNNSDEFKIGTSQSSKTFYYTESRYTNSAYQSQGGSWNQVNLSKTDASKDCYLVTCDETRYNIAPTTTPRHAFYAYYNTNVTLAIEDYEPALTYVKVYNNAMLQSGFDDNAYYGVKVGAKMKNSSEPVAEGKGYLFAKQIQDQIAEDAGKDGYPKDGSHVLYVDASNLNSVLYSKTIADYGTLENLKAAIGKNAMIYLPKGTTYTMDNLASKTVSGDFKAENNIILADRLPFFAPNDIRVDINNYTQYTREVTYNHGQTKYITLVLPFTMNVEDATHTNKDGKGTCKFYTMQLTNAISGYKDENNHDYEVTGHFTPITGTSTESNVPYLVEITYGDESTEADELFTVSQNGASIKATPVDANGVGTLLDGEAASGKIGTSDVNFTHHGSFNGVKLNKAEGTYFYFSKDRFVSSANLSAAKQNVYVMPFRSYFDFTGNVDAKSMVISLEPNEDTTGIDGIATTADYGFTFSSANGSLTITAGEAMNANVRNLNGQTMAAFNMEAGSSRTVSVPAGIYLVNGVKVLVK